jgi:hypothetical protein
MSTTMSKDGTLKTQRRLTTHQKAVLVQVLRTFPDERVRICYSPSAHDARSYAEDFVSVFRAIGWRVDGPDTSDESTAASALALVSSEMGLPPCAEALRDALRIYKIEVQVDCSAFEREEAASFLLRVGRNDQPPEGWPILMI